jgi:5-methylcytosine-specific restriction endonuclease McrA
MDKKKYRSYVERDCWNLRRQAYLTSHGPDCELCRMEKAAQVHHLNYERLGSETDDDLVALCEQCHRLLHRLSSRSRVEWILGNLNLLFENEEKYGLKVRHAEKMQSLMGQLAVIRREREILA